MEEQNAANNVEAVEVILVEDSSNDAELIKRALLKNNLFNNVVWFKSAEKALDFIFCMGEYANRRINKPPKVILLDLNLPEMGGLEMLAKIKADERTKTIPVVIVTSSQNKNDLQDAYKLGVNSYIFKPIQFDNFVESLSIAGLYWLAINKTAES